MTAWLHDIRYSLTALRKRPLHALVTVLVLAIAIGANTTVFSVFNGFFLRPLPYPEGNRLVMVYDSYPLVGLENAGTAIPDYIERREQAGSLEELAIYRMQPRTLSGDGEPERLLTALVSPSLFAVLRTEPALGRRFTEAEIDAGESRLAVLSHRLWATRFGARPDVIGRDIRLDGEPVQVIGVMPEGFAFPNGAVDAWLPFVITPEMRADTQRGIQFSQSIGRLRAGAAVEGLNAELAAIVRRNVAEGRLGADALEVAGFTGRARPLREVRVGDLEQTLLVLQAIVLAVLMIACANVANLQLARIASRARELAIRAAIGAGPGRLVRLVVAESGVLALVGAAVGFALARGGLALVEALGLERDGFDFVLDARVLAFTLGIAAVATAASSLPPILSLSREETMQALREAGRQGGGGQKAQTMRDGLVIAQLCLSVALLVGAGLLIKNFYLLQQEGAGFDAEGVLSAQISLPGSRYAEPEQWTRFHRRVVERLRGLPGVASAGFTSVLPFGGRNDEGSIVIDGLVPSPGSPPPHAQYRSVDEGYFSALEIPILAGRNLSASETEPVVIVDENLASKYWPGGALGQRLRRAVGDDRWYTIIGIVPAVKETSLATDAVKDTVYWHYEQSPANAGAYVVRTMLPPAQLTRAIRAAVAELDPELALFDIRTMQERVAGSAALQRTPMVLTALFAAAALVLAVLGVYAVLSWAVAQRTAAIGVRVALGAQSSDIVRMVLGHGLRLIGIGVVLGLVCALGLGRILGSQIRDLSAMDPIVLAPAVLTLAIAALLATWVPARRAAQVDPLRALRAE